MPARRCRLFLAIAVLFLCVFLCGEPLRAELALLTNGQVLKVKGVEVRDLEVRLALAAGGYLTLSMDRIERILDDEISPEPPPVEPAPQANQRVFSLEFEEAPIPETPFNDLIYAAAKRHSLNPQLLAAMARAESAFDRRAVSLKGARGLMQLMPATAARFGVAAGELFDPERNLEAASKYLRFLIREFDGELLLVLAAYNAGEGAVRRYDGVPPYRETRDYIARIYRFLELPLLTG